MDQSWKKKMKQKKRKKKRPAPGTRAQSRISSPSRLPPLLFQQSLPSYHLGKQRKTPPNSPLLSDQEERLTLALLTKQITLTYPFFPPST